MDAVEDPDLGRRIGGRLWRFFAGVVCGAALFVVVGLGAAELYNTAMSGDVELATVGADISAVGGETVSIRRKTGVVIQACNGVCDDLHVINRGRSNDLRDVQVIGRRGCIACESGKGAVLQGQRDLWTVSGRPQLAIRQDHLRAARDE